jgi:signal transduction histidine kinase
VPPHVRGQLFLILREAVRNAVEHAGAGRINVVLDAKPDKVVGRVEDDGRGLPRTTGAAADSRVGMRSMRERAALLGGALDIVSSPGGGTRIEASIPLEEA